MWEYKRKDFKFKIYSDLISELNKDGQEKWEIISYQEEKLEKYDMFTIAKILYKRLIIPVCSNQ